MTDREMLEKIYETVMEHKTETKKEFDKVNEKLDRMEESFSNLSKIIKEEVPELPGKKVV